MQLIDIAKGQFGSNAYAQMSLLADARERVFPRDANIDCSREFSGKRLISVFYPSKSKVIRAMRNYSSLLNLYLFTVARDTFPKMDDARRG